MQCKPQCLLLTLLCCTEFLVLNWFYGDIFYSRYVRLYIAFGNLMVDVDRQHNLQRQTLNNAGNIFTVMSYWYRCVFNVELKINNLYVLCVFINLSNQHEKRMCCIILSCIVFVSPYHNFSTLSHKKTIFNKEIFKHKTPSLNFLQIPSQKFIFLKRILHIDVLHICLSLWNYTLHLSEFAKYKVSPHIFERKKL
jgi:hypothetical protein